MTQKSNQAFKLAGFLPNIGFNGVHKLGSAILVEVEYAGWYFGLHFSSDAWQTMYHFLCKEK